MKEILALVLTFCLAIPVSANCNKPVIHIEKGKPAPCTGYLFSPKKEQEVRLAVEENKILKKQIELKDLSVGMLEKDVKLADQIVQKEREKAELWRTRAEDSTEKLVESESGRATRDVIMVAVGVLITVGAGFAIGAAAK